MKLTREELIQIANTVGERQGWDFSRVRDGCDPVPWDYLEVVGKYLKPTDQVLDVGTGGGENFLSLSAYFGAGVGIDISPAMIEAAQANKKEAQIENVSFEVMGAEILRFANETFDVVLNRHSVSSVDEVLRVLRPGGYFITQSVGHRNTENIFAAFGWQIESFGEDFWLSIAELATQFRQRDGYIRALAEYDVPYWFCDVESLVFWLKAVPLPEAFDMAKHWTSVNRVLAECITPRGIETNEHRELLVVQKP